MSVFKPKYKAGDGKTKPLDRWYVQFKDHRGVWRRIPGYPDKKLTVELDRKLKKLASFRSMNQELDPELVGWLEGPPREQKARLYRFDLLKASQAESTNPITKHVDGYSRMLASKERSERYIRESIARVLAIVNGCRFTFASDISVDKVLSWLKEQRDRGMGIATSNHYVTAFKAFCKWLSDSDLIGKPPRFQKLDASTDVRRERRVLPFEDFRALVDAASTGKPVLKISGRDRVMLYYTAAYTGLRAKELGSLTEASFDFRADSPTVTVAAAYSKHRRKDVVPIHPELVPLLQKWLSERRREEREATLVIPMQKPAPAKLWPGKWASGQAAATMVKHDLRKARDTWIEAAGDDLAERESRERPDRLKYQDDSGKYFDFHALRHQFISMLSAAGVHSKTAQELTRHSNINLTMNTYTHVGLRDLSAAVATLPGLPQLDVAALAKTGTDDCHIPNHMHKQGSKLFGSVHQGSNVGRLEPAEPEDVDGEENTGKSLKFRCNSTQWDQVRGGGFSAKIPDSSSGGLFFALVRFGNMRGALSCFDNTPGMRTVFVGQRVMANYNSR